MPQRAPAAPEQTPLCAGLCTPGRVSADLQGQVLPQQLQEAGVGSCHALLVGSASSSAGSQQQGLQLPSVHLFLQACAHLAG